jgi:hypothetical protein
MNEEQAKLALELEQAAPEVRARLEKLRADKEYEDWHWFQQLVSVRTTCFRCRVVSPPINVPAVSGRAVLAMGGRVVGKEVDISGDVIDGFAALGWRFELRRAYCPVCKGLG